MSAADYQIEQAMFDRPEVGEPILTGRSPGFQEEWLPEALRLCTSFGPRPAGVRCPACVFAQPLDRRSIAVVQVADRDAEAQGLRFRVLAVPRITYERVIGDPFLVDERFPGEWDAGKELPVLVWPATPPPQRSVAEIQDILKRSTGPAMLGSVQVLVDGGRVVFERPAPDAELVRGLWNLLPNSSRGVLWPASFAFGNALRFHAVVVPNVESGFADYVRESQAERYPESSYELRLQAAAEADDQEELDAVFTRRNTTQVWQFGLILVVVAALLAATAVAILPPAAQQPPATHSGPASPQGISPAPRSTAH
jgi:hypothetical protein